MNPQKLLGLILIIFFFLRKKLYQINQDLDLKGSVWLLFHFVVLSVGDREREKDKNGCRGKEEEKRR